MADNKPGRYDFFMQNNAPAPKKSLIPSFGSPRGKMFAVGGIAIVLLAAMFGYRTYQSNTNTAAEAKLAALALQQNEIVRLADEGVKKARSLEAKNLAATTQLSMSSEQKALQAALKKQGVKTSISSLDAAKKKQTDDRLIVAGQTNRFDEVFIEIMHADLQTYAKSLKQAHDEAVNASFKATLATQYQKAQALVTEEVAD